MCECQRAMRGMGCGGGYHGQFILELKFLDILGFIKDTIEINFTCSSVLFTFF